MEPQRSMNRGTLVVGSVLIVVGILFLVASILGRSVIGVWWPVFIVAVGLLFFLPLTLPEGGWGAFAIPGSIVTMTGLVLLFQNIFSAWASWAYAWALVAPFGVGAGLYLFGVHADTKGLKDAGSVVMKVGLILFLAFGFFFEGLLNVSGSLVVRIVWPVLLILVGLWVIVRPLIGGRQTGAATQTAVPAPAPPATQGAGSSRRCPTCGAEAGAEALFCNRCGTDLRPTGSAPTGAATTPPGEGV